MSTLPISDAARRLVERTRQNRPITDASTLRKLSLLLAAPIEGSEHGR